MMALRCVPEKYRLLHLGVQATERRDTALAPADAAVRQLLSGREQEVLTLVARGFSHGEIARLKDLSVHAVQTDIKNLYGKLAVHPKNKAVFEATLPGLLPHPR